MDKKSVVQSWGRWLRLLLAVSFLLSFVAACGGDEVYVPDDSEPEEVYYDDEGEAEYVPDASEPEEVYYDDEGVAELGETDSGFRPEWNGFGFENYGDDVQVTNLTAAEMQRMFGDGVCANQSGGTCTLTPPAREWMDTINQGMSGGHCEGMAVLSQLMYYGLIAPGDFGGEYAAELDLGEEALQREIAYWFVTQATYPGAAVKVNESPVHVVGALQDAFAAGFDAEEFWVVGIYQRDFVNGHAVTPYAVVDGGDGIFYIMVYDNNYPGEERQIEVDIEANTWWYEASPNPEVEPMLYEGDADSQTLEVVAITPRLGQQECTFCDQAVAGRGRAPGTARASQEYYEIWLEGQAHLLVVDSEGRRTGYADGKYINEIPGASALNLKTFQKDEEPSYRIPVGENVEIFIIADKSPDPIQASVSLIGPGYFLSVDGIYLEAGEEDSINIFIDGGRQQVTYSTLYSESPVIMLGMETPEADYAFMVQATEMSGAEDTFDVVVDFEAGDFILNTSANTEPSTYDFLVLMIDDEGEYVFGGSGLVMDPENTVYLSYRTWTPGSGLMAGMDYENDGIIDEEVELPDMGGEFYE